MLFIPFMNHDYVFCSMVLKFLTRFNLLFLYLQYVVIPTRRSTAEAFQILISHAFGDAGSPWLIGQVNI